jgi:ankyrin repeat protein
MRWNALTSCVVAVWMAASLAAVDADTRLIDAVKSGHRDAVRALLKAHIDVNQPEADGTTALHWAVRANDLETVRLLLHAGARVATANRYGVVPLSLAATNGSADMLEVLLKAGADPNAAQAEGETALMTAARTGTSDALQVLLAHGADVNAHEHWFGETALMWAAGHNHAAAVHVLIDHGAAIDARSNALEFPKTIFNGGAMVSTPLPRGAMTALMFAARDGGLEAVRVLCDAGAQLDLTDPDGTSALSMAIINGHYDVAALMVEKGADPNVADASGMGALYAVVDMRTTGRMINRPSRKPTDEFDSLALAKLLLEHRANPNAQLRTPLLQRYHNPGDPQLDAGATPLMRAAKSLDLPAVRLLLDKGANPNAMTKAYLTAVMFAAGAATGRNREADALQAIALCVKSGADVNAFNSNGQTALHFAAERGADALVKSLVEQGAELDLVDKDGRTPLDVAMGVPASTFQGRRGAPAATVHQSTATLLRQLASNAP